MELMLRLVIVRIVDDYGHFSTLFVGLVFSSITVSMKRRLLTLQKNGAAPVEN